MVAGTVLAGRASGHDLFLAAASIFPIVAAVFAARSPRVRDAAIAGLWIGLVGSVTLFVSTLIGSLAADYPDRASAGFAVSDDLGGLVVMLVPLPMAAAAVAAAAAAILGGGPATAPPVSATDGRSRPSNESAA